MILKPKNYAQHILSRIKENNFGLGASINHVDKLRGRGKPNDQLISKVKVSIKRVGGVKNTQKSLHMVYGWPLSYTHKLSEPSI